jgi:arylsulfatase A-like enzyme
VAEFYPIEHGFDEMKHFGAYYPGVYAYSDTSFFAHPWFPKFNAQYWDDYQKIVNLNEWSGTAGKPAVKGEIITYDNLSEFDMRQTDSAVEYIKQHAKDSKPFFMSVNFMKMHQPNNPSKMFLGKSRLGKYSDSMLELDYNIGRVMDVIRAEAPDTIVIITADNGAWQDAWPDAGTVPFRGEKGSAYEGGWRVPGIMWAPPFGSPGTTTTDSAERIGTRPVMNEARPAVQLAWPYQSVNTTPSLATRSIFGVGWPSPAPPR